MESRPTRALVLFVSCVVPLVTAVTLGAQVSFDRILRRDGRTAELADAFGLGSSVSATAC